jgi:dsRNA-specific ribonuclease
MSTYTQRGRGRGGFINRGGRGGYNNNQRDIQNISTSSKSSSSSSIITIPTKTAQITDVILAQSVTKKQQFKRIYIEPQPNDVESHSYDVNQFREYLINLLMTRGDIKLEEAQRYTDKEGMNEFVRATTHSSWNRHDLTDNYELLEHLGDTTISHTTTWYLSRRFPDIVQKGKDGVAILTRQKNMLASKPLLAKFCEKIGLNKYIRWKNLLFIDTKDEKVQKLGEKITPRRITLDRSMKEDIFEAFFGSLENIIDIKEGMIGIGNAIAYKVLASIYDQENIPVRKNDLWDPKTKVKEIIDKHRRDGWSINYSPSPSKETDIFATLKLSDEGEIKTINFGPISTLLAESDSDSTEVGMIEQLLAVEILDYLKTNYGITRFKEDE